MNKYLLPFVVAGALALGAYGIILVATEPATQPLPTESTTNTTTTLPTESPTDPSAPEVSGLNPDLSHPSEQGEDPDTFSPASLFYASATASISNGTVVVNSNGLPNHDTGEFPNSGNPNSISEQEIEKQFTLSPQKAARITQSTGMEFGIALNGILFEPLTGEFWNNDRDSGWNLEWSTNELGFDFNNAHVQPDGTYHYHGSPTSLLASIDGNMQTLIGYAADGFPIYVEDLSSSYQLKSGTRPDGPGGTYDGTYVEDYEYVEGLGELDECNGYTGSTPEYPEGTYYYVISDTFPMIGRCFWGTPDPSFEKMAGDMPQGQSSGRTGGPGQLPPPRR